MTNNKVVINVDNDADRDKMIGIGYAALTDKEIADAGIAGYERYVSPVNTTIKDGVITFTPPPLKKTPVPQSISPRQARLALIRAGMYDIVEQALAGMEGAEGQMAKVTWEYATEVKRDDPLLLQLTTSLGMSGEQVDQLFMAAVAL